MKKKHRHHLIGILTLFHLFGQPILAATIPDYDPSQTYKKLTDVMYGGQKWRAMYWVEPGMTPSETQGPWALFEEKRCSDFPAWEAKEYATAFTKICYQGAIYQNQWWANPGDIPSKAGLWQKVENTIVPPGPPPYKPVPACPSFYTPLQADALFKSRKDIDYLFNNGDIKSRESVATSFSSLSQTQKDYILKQLSAAYALPCQPAVDAGNMGNNQYNVQNVMQAFPIETWNMYTAYLKEVTQKSPKNSEANKKSIERNWQDIFVENGGGPVLTSTLSYENFLKVVARYPHFCGDPTTSDNGKVSVDTCRREIAAMFGHAAQETGGHDTIVDQSKYPENRQILSASRENNQESYAYEFKPITTTNWCYTNYGGNDQKLLDDYQVCYYGRGLHQLSHPSNYANFSAVILGDPDFLLKYPDHVARDGYLILASAVYFYMTPDPPKPSIHAMFIGNYKPGALYNYGTPLPEKTAKDYRQAVGPLGINISNQGEVADPFKFSTSAINGAYECSLETFENPEWKKDTKGQLKRNSQNRHKYYLQSLNDMQASMNTSENSYIAGQTYCDLPHNSLFAYTWNDLTTFGAMSTSADFTGMFANKSVLTDAIPMLIKYDASDCSVYDFANGRMVPLIAPKAYPDSCIKQ